MYYLNPNTSVVTVTISGPTGKIPVYIVAFADNGSKAIPIPIKVDLGNGITVLTPQVVYLDPGSYTLDDINGSPIFLSSYGLTANFLDWSIVGSGYLSEPNNLDTQFTLTGPMVITAVYNASLQKYQVTIEPQGILLGGSSTNNGITITSLNTTIPVIINNKVYNVGSSGITLNLTYGYHIIEFPQEQNITFNYLVIILTPHL
ncbi:hypothetical protein [Acidianus manzaensis]|uniref:hypothetical protein n=1 Tax=Acidianus manzaensis TaxID=282676 RepID=UPI001F315FB8|nr:hypothetical protein [Acidianus manzaensis]